MALRAGYFGIKKKLITKLKDLPAIKTIGAGLALQNGNLVVTGDLEDYAPNIIANTQLLTDSLGWSGKNKFPYDNWKGCPLHNGSAVFENNGATITASANDCYTEYGAASGYPASARMYVKSGEKVIFTWDRDSTNVAGKVGIFENGDTTHFKTEDSTVKKIEYTPTQDCYLSIRCGVANSGTSISYSNLMVRKADILDSTYEPYRDTTAFPRDEQIKLGARQLITPKFMPVDENTTHGITYTDNGNGTININGTASERSYYNYHAREGFSNVSLDTDPIYLDAGDYIYSKEDTQVEAQIFVLKNGAGVVIATINSNQTEARFTLTERTRIGTQVSVISGVTINNLTFKPTIRLATDPNPNWSPYAMTNRELTDAVNVGYEISAVADLIAYVEKQPLKVAVPLCVIDSAASPISGETTRCVGQMIRANDTIFDVFLSQVNSNVLINARGTISSGSISYTRNKFEGTSF